MAKRKERNMSGTFIALIEGEVLGPFIGREKAIKEAKAKMNNYEKMLSGDGYNTIITEADAEIYHRVTIVKAKNKKETDNGSTQPDVPFDTTESVQGSESRTAL